MHLLLMKLMFVSCLMLAVGAQAATFNVRDYGAARDDGNDDTPAVRKALEEAARAQNARLVFPQGRYDFHPEEGRGTLFTVDGANGLTIDGGGSEFVVHGVVGLFSFANCTDLSVSGFTLDYARPPFSVGRVIAAEGNHFDVEVFPEYPVKGGEPVGAFMDWDPETRMYVRHGLDEYYTATGTELLRPQVLRVNLKHEARIRPGVWVVLRHQVYGPAAVWLGRCVRSNLRDITIREWGSSAMSARTSRWTASTCIPATGARCPRQLTRRTSPAARAPSPSPTAGSKGWATMPPTSSPGCTSP